MYAGQGMEARPAADALTAPAHPYTAALLAALPERAAARAPAADDPGCGAGAGGPAAGLRVRAALLAGAGGLRRRRRRWSRCRGGVARCLFPLA